MPVAGAGDAHEMLSKSIDIQQRHSPRRRRRRRLKNSNTPSFVPARRALSLLRGTFDRRRILQTSRSGNWSVKIERKPAVA